MVRPLDEVAAEIKRDLAIERARNEIRALYDKIEDERGGGANACRDWRRRSACRSRPSRRSTAPAAVPTAIRCRNVPEGANLYSARIFSAEIGTENDPVQLAERRRLCLVRGDVEHALARASARRSARARDRALAQRSGRHATLKELAKEAAEKLKTSSVSGGGRRRSAPSRNSSSALRRDRTQGDFPPNALDAVFQTPKDRSRASRREQAPPNGSCSASPASRVPQARPGLRRCEAASATTLAECYCGRLVAQYHRAICRPRSAPPSTRPRSIR